MAPPPQPVMGSFAPPVVPMAPVPSTDLPCGAYGPTVLSINLPCGAYGPTA